MPISGRERAGTSVEQRPVSGGVMAPADRDRYWLFWAQLTDGFAPRATGVAARDAQRQRVPADHPRCRAPRSSATFPATASESYCSCTPLTATRISAASRSSFATSQTSLPGLRPQTPPRPRTTPPRTQTRLAVYHTGTIEEQHNWPTFLDWFQAASAGVENALHATPTIRCRTATMMPHNREPRAADRSTREPPPHAPTPIDARAPEAATAGPTGLVRRLCCGR